MRFVVEIEVERTGGMNRSWEQVQEALEMELLAAGLTLDVEDSEFEVTNVTIAAAPHPRRVRARQPK